MKYEDNSVNINRGTGDVEGDSRNYHHGDLRAKALKLGMEIIEKQEHPELGLRALARQLGVSATALYRHFPSKDALFDAFALEALNRLGEHQAQAAKAAGGGRLGFAEVGITYVAWAVANPSLLRLINTRIQSVDLGQQDNSDMGEALRQLKTGIAAMLPPNIAEERRIAAELHAWSLVHGLSMLILDGLVKHDPKLVRQVVSLASFHSAP